MDFDGLWEDEKHQHWKSQLALAGEVFGPHPMTSQEFWIAQLGAECFDEGDEMSRNVIQN